MAALSSCASSRTGPDVGDHELVEAVRAGDDRAFELLYRRYDRRIAAYIHGLCRDHARAEDLTQDVFMAALRRMRETDRPIAFKPWIYEIAKNACIDQFRRGRRTEEVSFDAEDALGAADQRRLTCVGPSPDAAVDTKLSLDHLLGAFGGLSETHHQILVMRELEGLSYREIGERLGMSRQSVESTLFRARRRLTEEYAELETGERCLRVQSIITDAPERALGAREQRKVTRHITHCRPCRRHAVMAGLDAAGLARRPVRAQIVAFLPLPAMLHRWFGGRDAAVAQLSTAAAPYSDSAAGWTKGAVAATVLLAGIGGGAAVQGHGAPARDGASQPRQAASQVAASHSAVAQGRVAQRRPSSAAAGATSGHAARGSTTRTSLAATTATGPGAVTLGAGSAPQPAGAGGNPGSSATSRPVAADDAHTRAPATEGGGLPVALPNGGGVAPAGIPATTAGEPSTPPAAPPVPTAGLPVQHPVDAAPAAAADVAGGVVEGVAQTAGTVVQHTAGAGAGTATAGAAAGVVREVVKAPATADATGTRAVGRGTGGVAKATSAISHTASPARPAGGTVPAVGDTVDQVTHVTGPVPVG
jgi:RNA polymerase sigma factor (sigma-70 family)